MEFDNLITESIRASLLTKEKVLASLVPLIAAGGALAAECLAKNNKLLLCGNGGSSCDASHIAAELIVRFKTSNNRRSLPAISLSGDAAVITACANDNGYDKVFARQVEGLGREGDCLLALSTSGNSENIIGAVQTAKAVGMKTVSLLGKNGGRLKGLADIDIIVPAEDTARIQEAHIMIGHIFCAIIEKKLFDLN